MNLLYPEVSKSLDFKDYIALAQMLIFLLGFIIAILTLRQNGQFAKVNNLISLTTGHREIWKEIIEDEELSKIMDYSENPACLTARQRAYVNFLILHLFASFEACEPRGFVSIENLALDIKSFLSLPLPAAVWNENKKFHNVEFTDFVEKSLIR